MSFRDLLFGYVHGEELSSDEIIYLEKAFEDATKEISPSNLQPVIAFSDICDAAGMEHESFEIICVAAILDKISPKHDAITRQESVAKLLKISGF